MWEVRVGALQGCEPGSEWAGWIVTTINRDVTIHLLSKNATPSLHPKIVIHVSVVSHWFQICLGSILIPIITPRPPTVNGSPTPAHSAFGPSHPIGGTLILEKLILLVYWPWNHYMTFPYDLASWITSDRSSIIILLQLNHD